MAGYWAAIGQGASTAAAGGLFSGLGLIGQNRRNRKLIEQQLEAQKQLTDYSGDVNYRYGEMSAENAHERTKELWAMDQAANSFQGQVADAKEAGLSVGLLYGGGGAGGAGGGSTRGAQGDGAGVGTPQAPDFLEIEALKTQKRLAFAEIARASAEASLTKAERDKTEAETENLKDQTETSKELTPVQKELIRQEGIQKLIENMKEHTKLGADATGETNIDQETYNAALEWAVRINNDSFFHKELTYATAKLAGEVEGVNIQNELNTQEKEIAWRNLLLAEAEGKISKIKAAAIKMAALWAKGILSNPRTWREAIETASEGFLQVLEEAGQ